jgi:hypothetical protein
LWCAAAALSGLAALLAAGCNSSKSAAPPATTSATTSPSSTAPESTSPAAGVQKVTITPSTGLSSPQKVSVSATGFSPNESLTVIQCADKGNNTGQGDCNLSGMSFVTSNAAGNVSIQFTVVKGPFGSNNIVCGPTQPCLVSVSQATLAPTQEADARISFS